MIVSWPPFIHTDLDARKFYLRKTASLIPLAAAAIYCFGGEYLARLIFMALVSLLYFWIRRASPDRSSWGPVLYDTVLLSLLWPKETAWYLCGVGALCLVFFRWLGSDRNRISPINWPATILALVWVAAGKAGPPLERLASVPFWFGPAYTQYFLCGPLPSWASALALWLLLNRQIKYGLWLGLVAPILILSGLWWYNSQVPTAASVPWPLLLNGLAAAGILLNDEASTPRPVWAQTVLGMTAAAIFALGCYKGLLYAAVIWSAFIPGLITPWLDETAAYGRWWPRFSENPK